MRRHDYQAWEWIKRLRVGDVLRARSGRLRIVRSVHHWGPGIPQTSVSFTIIHCSWTTRPYTTLTGNDLRAMGYELTRARAGRLLNDAFSRTLRRDMTANKATECVLHCCDVRGVA